MSLSIRVVGIKPPDEEYTRKLAAYEACVVARVMIPQELTDFFGGCEPSIEGTFVPIQSRRVANDIDGIEVDVDSLPESVKIIRFLCSY